MPQKKEEEYITNKVLVVFSLCLFGVLILMGVKNLVSHGNSYLTGMMVVRVLIGVSVLGMILGLFMFIREKKNHLSTYMRIVTGRNVFLVFAISFIIFTLIYYYLFPIFTIFYVVLPVLAVYYLVYHSYQREFFIIAFDGGMAVAMLFVVRRALVSSNVKQLAWAAVAVMAVIFILQLIFALMAKSNNGTLKLFNKEYSFEFSANAYKMIIFTPLLMVLLVLAGAAFGSNIALYAMFAVAAYLVVTAVYYTVKLM